MDLQQEWNNMNNELLNRSETLAADKIEIQKSSKNAYMNLLAMFRAKMNWITAISLPMLIGAFFADGLLKYLLLAMFLCHQALRLVMLKRINQLPNHIDYSLVTRHFLESQLASMRSILRQERIWSYLYGPLAVPFAYMCMKAYKHKTFDQIVANEPHMFYTLFILAMFVFPIIYFSERANKKAFWKDINRLRGHLDILTD